MLLAAAAKWYEDHGLTFSLSHQSIVSGDKVTGFPWRAQQLLQFKSSLEKLQAKSGSNPVRRAYKLTHDDVASTARHFVAVQLGDALNPDYLPGTNPKVDWLKFQVGLMVIAAFGSGARGAELVRIRLSDIHVLSEGIDTAIGVTLQGVKSKTASRIVRRIIFPTWMQTSIISPALAVLIQLSVVHGLYGAVANVGSSCAPLFPNIVRNQVQKGKVMPPKTFGTALKEMFIRLGITDAATKHSPRRVAGGFRYYVMNENMEYI